MSRTRIAVFEGFGRGPKRRGARRYGAPLFNNPRMSRYGAPLFNNPRMSGYGFDPREMPAALDGLGRRAYYVPPLYGRSRMGPVTEEGRHAKRLKRKGYHVKKGRNTKWQSKFKKIAKTCARKSRNGRKGAYQACMRKALRKAKRSRR